MPTHLADETHPHNAYLILYLASFKGIWLSKIHFFSSFTSLHGTWLIKKEAIDSHLIQGGICKECVVEIKATTANKCPHLFEGVNAEKNRIT